MSSTDDLPPALSSMWRALKRGYEAEPTLLLVAFGLSLLAALPDALLALWLKLLADGVLEGGMRVEFAYFDGAPDGASCVEILGFDDAAHAFMAELKRKGTH